MAASNKKEQDLKDFKDLEYLKINRTIANARFAFDNDATVSSTIMNAILIAKSGMKVVADDPQYNDAAKYIQDKFNQKKEDGGWDFNNMAEEVLKKSIRDGACFINKWIEGGTYQIRFLAYDGNDNDFKIIRDPETEKVLAYKQKYITSKLPEDWENKNFNQLNELTGAFEYATLKPEEIINPMWNEEDGEGQSAIYPALNDVNDKLYTKKLMRNSNHKSGKIVHIQLGAIDYVILSIYFIFVLGICIVLKR